MPNSMQRYMEDLRESCYKKLSVVASYGMDLDTQRKIYSAIGAAKDVSSLEELEVQLKTIIRDVEMPEKQPYAPTNAQMDAATGFRGESENKTIVEMNEQELLNAFYADPSNTEYLKEIGKQKLDGLITQEKHTEMVQSRLKEWYENEKNKLAAEQNIGNEENTFASKFM